MHKEHFDAKVLEIFPLILGGAELTRPA